MTTNGRRQQQTNKTKSRNHIRRNHKKIKKSALMLCISATVATMQLNARYRNSEKTASCHLRCIRAFDEKSGAWNEMKRCAYRQQRQHHQQPQWNKTRANFYYVKYLLRFCSGSVSNVCMESSTVHPDREVLDARSFYRNFHQLEAFIDSQATGMMTTNAFYWLMQSVCHAREIKWLPKQSKCCQRFDEIDIDVHRRQPAMMKLVNRDKRYGCAVGAVRAWYMRGRLNLE